MSDNTVTREECLAEIERYEHDRRISSATDDWVTHKATDPSWAEWRAEQSGLDPANGTSTAGETPAEAKP